MLGRTTNIRIIFLNNCADGEEDSFLFKKKEAAASAADILKTKLRWPFTTLTRQSSPFPLPLEVAPTHLGKRFLKKPESANFSA
jgi:hypothetical protein